MSFSMFVCMCAPRGSVSHYCFIAMLLAEGEGERKGAGVFLVSL